MCLVLLPDLFEDAAIRLRLAPAVEIVAIDSASKNAPAAQLCELL